MTRGIATAIHIKIAGRQCIIAGNSGPITVDGGASVRLVAAQNDLATIFNEDAVGLIGRKSALLEFQRRGVVAILARPLNIESCAFII